MGFYFTIFNRTANVQIYKEKRILITRTTAKYGPHELLMPQAGGGRSCFTGSIENLYFTINGSTTVQ